MAEKDKIFVFDLDGTWPTQPSVTECRKPSPEYWQTANKVKQYKGFIGGGTKKQVERLLISTGAIPECGLDFYFKLFQDRYYQDPVKDCILYEGVLELLELLKKAGIKSTICTQKFEASAKKVLLHLNIYQYFDGFAYGDSTGVLKPDPKVFYHSVKGLSNGKYFYVGDTTVDLLYQKPLASFFIKGYAPQKWKNWGRFQF